MPMWVLCCMFCVKLLLKVSLNFQQIQLVLTFHVHGQSLKGHIVIQNLLKTNIYKAKFGKEPPKKKFKPSPSVAERKYSFTFEEDEDLERKIKLKNDLLIANERSSLPPVFHLITGKLPNELEAVQQSSQELSHEMQDIDLAHALEVEVETSTKIELPVHTQASAVNNLGQCSKAHKSSAIDSIISPPKQQPVSLTEIKDRA